MRRIRTPNTPAVTNRPLAFMKNAANDNSVATTKRSRAMAVAARMANSITGMSMPTNSACTANSGVVAKASPIRAPHQSPTFSRPSHATSSTTALAMANVNTCVIRIVNCAPGPNRMRRATNVGSTLITYERAPIWGLIVCGSS